MFYFAFGSNMSRVQTPRRCPGARPVGAARLDGWRLMIGARGGATIVPEDDAVTHGVLWRFLPHHMALMDRWEGVASGIYRPRWLGVEKHGGRRVTALTYIAASRYAGTPRANYIYSAMLVGARDFDLPETYQEEIRALLPRRPIGANEPYRGRRLPSKKSNTPPKAKR